MQIKIPLPLKISTNKIYGGIHWATRKKHADLYHAYMLKYRSLKLGVGKALDITYFFHFKSRLLDTTNCSYMVKLIEDGMVKCGILGGDDPRYVRSTRIMVSKGDIDEVEIIFQ